MNDIMKSNMPTNALLSLIFEFLKTKPEGQFNELLNGVLKLAIDRNLISVENKVAALEDPNTQSYLSKSDGIEVPEKIRQLMWRLLIQNIIVFGNKDCSGPAGNFPFYTVTEYGIRIIDKGKPQPYDPDNFLREFKSLNPKVDSVIVSYLEEAVRSFNHDCPKSAAVMIGCASEKAILLLFDLFVSKISDLDKKRKFEKAARVHIHSKFKALHDRLTQMTTPKELDGEWRDIVILTLPGIYDLIRRNRNSAGHPDNPGNIDNYTIFLNLRIFSDYINRIYKLIQYFKKHEVNW